jgi:hypothetical protein
MNIVDQRTEAKKERVPVVPGGVYVQGESAMLLVVESSPFHRPMSTFYFVSLSDGSRLTVAFDPKGIAETLNAPDSNITYIPDATLILKGAK